MLHLLHTSCCNRHPDVVKIFIENAMTAYNIEIEAVLDSLKNLIDAHELKLFFVHI